QALNSGRSYIKHIPDATIQKVREAQQFEASSVPQSLKDCDCILICVPTPLSKMRDPDMTYVIGTAETIRTILRPGQLIVLESTTYPGTTKDLVKPILEKSGLKAGKDFYLAFSPEREDPGRQDFSTETITKVVGGYDPASLELASALYGSAI